MDFFDRATSNLGKLWSAMWDNKTKTKKKKGIRPRGDRFDRYTEAFLTDDRSYEDNVRVATKNQKRDAKKFLKKRAAPRTLHWLSPRPRPKKML